MTRRLQSLRIGNFKAFADTQRIPLKPITLIFGPNSSGKSSFIHSLALAHEAMRTGNLDIHRTEIGGASIDLGGFRQFVHKTDRTRRVEWGLDLAVSELDGLLREQLGATKTLSIDLAFGLEGELPEAVILASLEPADETISPLQMAGEQDKESEHDEAKVVLIAYELLADEKPILRMSRRRDGGMAIDALATDHPIFERIVAAIVEAGSFRTSIGDAERAAVFDAINELVPSFFAKVANFLPEFDPLQPLRGANEPALSDPVESLARTVRLFFPRQLATLTNTIHRVVREEIGAVSYLGPLRSFPARHMAFAEHDDRNWVAGGGYAWELVKADDTVRDKVNAWLGAAFMKTPYRFGVRALVGLDQIKDRLASELEELVESLEVVRDREYGHVAQIDDPNRTALEIIRTLRKSNIDKVLELVLIDQRTKTVVSHRDVGIGISQVLPVLVQAFAASRKIVAMEQPEIHLHPALQAELGDVFIEAALSERQNTLILETHSEHLMLRLLRRIREKKISAEAICVVFVEPLDRGSRFIELRIDEDGDFIDEWPGGFFEESFHEKFAGQ